MSTEQLDLLAVANHPRHDEDRDRCDAAIIADGKAHAGWIDQQRVRESLTNDYGLNVSPRTLSARYGVLASRGRIVKVGWHVNTSSDGGNGGKQYPTWRLSEYVEQVSA